ncbi:hypothetical protein BB560_002888, partial [Smittium megazygosporum]
WIKAHNMRNTGSWMDLQMRHPDIKLGLQDIGKIRMGCYWTAQRLAKAGLIPKMYIERCPFCNKNTPETIEHMLIECFRWNSIRHETTIFNIPRLYKTVTIDQSTNNQALNQGRNIMVGKLLGEESKETRSLLAQSRDRYSPYMKELETGRFMNGIRVVRTLILDRIKLLQIVFELLKDPATLLNLFVTSIAVSDLPEEIIIDIVMTGYTYSFCNVPLHVLFFYWLAHIS